jgi:hypothetical protein
MATNDNEGVDRLNAVKSLVEGIRASYADAKKLHISVEFEWVETDFYTGAELCPVVKVDVER